MLHWTYRNKGQVAQKTCFWHQYWRVKGMTGGGVSFCHVHTVSSVENAVPLKRPALRLLISQPDGPENKQNRFCCGYGRKCMGIKGEDKRKLTACRLLVPLIMFEQRRYEDSENWAKSYAMVGRGSMVTGSVFVRLGCFHVDVNVVGPFLSSLKGGRRRGARRYHINHRNS